MIKPQRLFFGLFFSAPVEQTARLRQKRAATDAGGALTGEKFLVFGFSVCFWLFFGFS